MLRRTMLLLAAATLVGCADGPAYSPQARPTQLAAYAARNQYPKNLPEMDGIPVTAVVDKRTGDITIRNFSSRSLQAAQLWVNETYVLQLDQLGPNGAVVVRNEDMFNSLGNSLAQQPATAVKQVDMVVDNQLLRVEGPQFK